MSEKREWPDVTVYRKTSSYGYPGIPGMPTTVKGSLRGEIESQRYVPAPTQPLFTLEEVRDWLLEEVFDGGPYRPLDSDYHGGWEDAVERLRDALHKGPGDKQEGGEAGG